MFDLSHRIPEESARNIYNNKDLLNSLDENEQRVVFQSIYFYDKELFAHDVTERWVKDQVTGEEFGTPEFHKEIWGAGQDKQDVLCIVARDHAKTTAESKINTLHELIYKTEKSILIISAKGLGEKIVGDIKKELETNQKIRWLYGSLIPQDARKESKSEKWRQRYLQLLNGTELMSISKGEPIRGFRPTKIKVDDPQNKKDVKNPQIAEEFYTWFFTEVYGTLDDSASVIILATIISANCFANKLKKEADERDFKVIEYAAILNFDETKITLGERNGKPWYYFGEGVGTPLWPQKWPLSALERRYNKIKKKAFLQEYQNIPFIENGTPVFEPTYTYEILTPIDHVDGFDIYVPIEKWVFGFFGIDLAKGASTGDFQAVIIRDEHYNLLAQCNLHISQSKLAARVDKMVIRFQDCFIVVENNYGLAFLQSAEEYEWFDKLYMQKKMDTVTKKESDVIGFNTNGKTKTLIIDNLDKKFESENYQVSAEEKEQIDYYYNDDRGGMNAISPHHDDLVIADALSVVGVKQGLPGPILIVM